MKRTFPDGSNTHISSHKVKFRMPAFKLHIFKLMCRASEAMDKNSRSIVWHQVTVDILFLMSSEKSAHATLL